jgi:hypothetical protein
MNHARHRAQVKAARRQRRLVRFLVWRLGRPTCVCGVALLIGVNPFDLCEACEYGLMN